MNDEYKENVKYETFTHFWNDNFGADYGYDKENERMLEPYYSIAEYAWEMGENHGYYLGKDYGNTEEPKEDNSIPTLSEFESAILKDSIVEEKEEHKEEKVEKFFNELYTTYKPYLDTAEKYLFDNDEDDYFDLDIRIKDLVLHIEYIRIPNRKYLTYKSYLKFYVENEWLYEKNCIYSTLTIGLNEKWEIRIFNPNNKNSYLGDLDLEKRLWSHLNSYLSQNDENELWNIFLTELKKACVEQVKRRKIGE